MFCFMLFPSPKCKWAVRTLLGIVIIFLSPSLSKFFVEFEFWCASKTFPRSFLVEHTLETEDVVDGCTFEPDWCFCDWSKNTAGSPGCQYIMRLSRNRTRAVKKNNRVFFNKTKRLGYAVCGDGLLGSPLSCVCSFIQISAEMLCVFLFWHMDFSSGNSKSRFVLLWNKKVALFQSSACYIYIYIT